MIFIYSLKYFYYAIRYIIKRRLIDREWLSCFLVHCNNWLRILVVMQKKRRRGAEEQRPDDVSGHITETDRIIAAALKDERRERREKMELAVGDAKGDYLSDSDVGESEEEEEGMRKDDGTTTIRESMVDMAHAKREALRKGKGMEEEDFGLVADITRAEEGYEVRKDMEKEHGIALEAFNLVEERERGYFDKEGNYVEKVTEEEEGEDDAWLADGQDKDVVDETTRRKIEDRMKREEEARDLNVVDIARMQYKISAVLMDGETVAGALKRLAGSIPRGADRRAGKQSSQDTRTFDMLTEYATVLLDAGETDVYSKDKAYFQRAASVYIDLDDNPMDALQGASRPSEDASEDMFASDDDHDELEPPSSFPDNTKKKKKTVFSEWPTKELKRFCEEHGKTCTGITEKDELVQIACDIEQDLAARVQKAADSTAVNMDGVIFENGHWMSKDRLFFWDETEQSWQPTNT